MDTEESEGGSTMADSEGAAADSETQEEDNISDAENRHEIGAVKCRKCELSFPSLYHLHYHMTLTHRSAILDDGNQGYGQSVEPLALNLKISNAIDVENSKPEFRKLQSGYEPDLRKDMTVIGNGALDLSNTSHSYGALDLSTTNTPNRDMRKAEEAIEGGNSLSDKEVRHVIDYSLPNNLRRGETTLPRFENPGLQGKPHKFFSRYPPPDHMPSNKTSFGVDRVNGQESSDPKSVDRNVRSVKDQEDQRKSPGSIENDISQMSSFYPTAAGYSTNQNMGMMGSIPYPFNLQQQMLMMGSPQNIPVSDVSGFLTQKHITQMAQVQSNLLGSMQYSQDLPPYAKSKVGPVKPTSTNKRSRTKASEPTGTGQKSVLEIYECKICNRKFSQVGNFHNHMKLHNEKVCVCGICRAEFADSYELQRHMRKEHTGDMPYKCDECDREFSQYNNLRRHLRVHSGKTYKCHICGRTFNEVFYLEMHIGSHTGERTYRCGVCNLTFRDNAELQKHVQTHSAAELHTCDVCGKSFSKACVLRQHKKMHSGIRPYKCDICEKAFIHRHHLKIHSRMHSTSKPFQCKICGKDFAQTSHLYKHIRQHTDISPELAKSMELEAKELNSKEARKLSPKPKSKEPSIANEVPQSTSEAINYNDGNKCKLATNDSIVKQEERQTAADAKSSDINAPMLYENQTDTTKTSNEEDDRQSMVISKSEEEGISSNSKSLSFLKYQRDESTGRTSQSESGVGSDDDYSDTERTLCIDEDRDDGDVDSIYSDITVESEKGTVNVIDVHVQRNTDSKSIKNENEISDKKNSHDDSTNINDEYCNQIDSTSSCKSFRRDSVNSPSFDSASPASSIGSSLTSSIQSEDLKISDKLSDIQGQSIQGHGEIIVSSSMNHAIKSVADSSSVCQNYCAEKSESKPLNHTSPGRFDDVKFDKGKKRTTDDVDDIEKSHQRHGVDSPEPLTSSKPKQRRRRKKTDQPYSEQGYYPPIPNMGMEAQQMYMLQLHQMQIALAASMTAGPMFPFSGSGGLSLPENFYPKIWNPLIHNPAMKEKGEKDLPANTTASTPHHLNISNSSISDKYLTSAVQGRSPIDSTSCQGPEKVSSKSDIESYDSRPEMSKVISSGSVLKESVDSSEFLRNYYRFSGSPFGARMDVPNYANLPRPLVQDGSV